MDELFQQVSYLRGLADGLGIEESTKEGKLLLHIIDVLDDFANALGEVDEKIDDVDEYVSYMDEDLADVEEEVFGFLDEYDDMYFDDDDYDYMEDEDLCECDEGCLNHSPEDIEIE